MKIFMFVTHLLIVIAVVAHMNQMHAKKMRVDIVGWWALGFGSALEMAEAFGGRLPADWDWGVSLMSVGVLVLVVLWTQPVWRQWLDRRMAEPLEAPAVERRVERDLKV